MRREPRLTKRERRGEPASSDPCVRPLRPQLVPHAPARIGEHPRSAVKRLELLTDAELDGFRGAHGERAEAALDLALHLDALVEERLAEKGLTNSRLGTLAQRPTLAVFVCTRCGASDIGTEVRSGVLARAIDRTKIAERDLRAVEALLAEAWAPEPPPNLDRLPPSAIVELVALVGADVDLETLKARVTAAVVRAGPSRS